MYEGNNLCVTSSVFVCPKGNYVHSGLFFVIAVSIMEVIYHMLKPAHAMTVVWLVNIVLLFCTDDLMIEIELKLAWHDPNTRCLYSSVLNLDQTNI